MSHMTAAQLPTLKAAILADPVLAAKPDNPDGNSEIAAAFNVLASPNFTVWRTNVTRTEVSANMDWTRVDNLSVGKARIWDWMFNAGSVNVGDSTIRAGIDAVWVGTQADLAVRASVYSASKRLAKRGEKLYATGTGSDASPASLTFEGDIDYTDVHNARIS